jgi:hypothetical protein
LPRRLQLEPLEQRVLFAISPTLAAVIPNEGAVMLPGDVRNLAPRELTFRFDDGQIIDAASLGGIQIISAGGDGIFGNGNDLPVVPGFVGIGEKTNEVIYRFSGNLPDDQYRITIFGTGANALKNTEGDVFNNGVNHTQDFRLNLGPQILAVVPQPISRNALGDLVQAKDQIVIYFNGDKLSTAAAQNVEVYQLIRTQDTASSADDQVFKPISAAYNQAGNFVTLTFAQDLATMPGSGTFRLRVGQDVPDNAPMGNPPTLFNGLVDAGSEFSTARSLGIVGTGTGMMGSTSLVVMGAEVRNTTVFNLNLPGGNNEPGHRDIPFEAHLSGADGNPFIGVQKYNFQSEIGTDPLGNTSFNFITEIQKQRAREVFEIYGRYLGIQFIETDEEGWTIATGDPRVLSPTIPVGPGGVGGIAGGGRAIMNSGIDWGVSEFGGGWFNVAMHEIGHLLGLGHTYDLPPLTVQGSEGELAPTGAEPVFPGDHDIVHGQHLWRPESRDVDFYRFVLPTAGRLTAEIFADRMQNQSLLDSVLSLYDSNGVLIARNDDYFSADSFLDLVLNSGTYYIGVSSTGNTRFDPNVHESGFGGTTEGIYDLRINFVAEPSGGLLTDASGILLDGDADGRAGGQFNFWFQAGQDATAGGDTVVFYVDKASRFRDPVADQKGTLAKPFLNIDDAIAAANASLAARKIIRVVGNGGQDGSVLTVSDNLAYEIGFNILDQALQDGSTLDLPRNTTMMVDAGAIFKLRAANIAAGSFAQGIDLSSGAIQVLGTPTQSVYFTSYHNDAIGVDTAPSLPTSAAKGDWGGLVFRSDSDLDRHEQLPQHADRAIFLNYVSFADISYGGGRVLVDNVPETFNPIHIQQSRPTIINNRITDSAVASISADPDAFEETIYADNAYTADYRRVGPEIHGNTLLRNSINGLFIRIRTQAGIPLDVMTVSGRFDDTDITHVITENLFIKGSPGGFNQDNDMLDLDARLAIDPGILLKLSGSRIEVGVGAQLIAEGTPGRSVIFTSLLDDRYGTGGVFDVTGDGLTSLPAPGNWGGIYFHPVSKGSIDQALITFAGGRTAIEGTFASFNPIEIRQADVRITRTIFELNANGEPADGSAITDRAGRGPNLAGTIFVRGAQPILVDNIIRNNFGAAININVNALNYLNIVDSGRSTGAINRYTQFDDNFGALVRLNRVYNNELNGMGIRHGTLTTQSIWDDTDIVHVVFGEIVVPDFHTYGGLRLQSSATESLVVKFLSAPGETAGLTATGRGLDIDDRIGGSLQIIGRPGKPVILTSLYDSSVGAGFDADNNPVLRTINSTQAPSPADWRGLEILAYSNDRNVEVLNELEPTYTGTNDVNNTTTKAQVLGILASDEKNGDENRRLGFEVHGFISPNNTRDVDVYSFNAVPGTEVWIDIDRTNPSLDTIIELIDSNGQIIATSNNSPDESAGLLPLSGDARIMQRGEYSLEDLYTMNQRDAGMRVVLRSNQGTLPPGQTLQYFVRVRSANPNAGAVFNTLTSGQYQLQIRLREMDEVPGSTVRFADIRYATDGIAVRGMPAHSPLMGTYVRGASPNSTYETAQDLGNLLASDRNTISLASVMNSPADVQWYKFTLDIQAIQSIGSYSDAGKTWATIFDIDYADGLSRPDLTLALFDGNQNLLFLARDSDIVDDQPAPGTSTTDNTKDTTRGSFGKLDAYLGTVQLAEGTNKTYYIAISSNAALPVVLDQFFVGTPSNPLLRLEPVNSIRRVIEDHVGFTGFVDSFGNQISPSTPAILPIGNLATGTTVQDALRLQTNVRPFNLSDVTLFVQQESNFHRLVMVDPRSGSMEAVVRAYGGTENFVGDIAIRSDGAMFGYQFAGTGDIQEQNVGQLVQYDPGTGLLYDIGLDSIADNGDGEDPDDPNTVTSSDPTAIAFRRLPGFDTIVHETALDNYAMYYGVSDFFRGSTRLFWANPTTGAGVQDNSPFGAIGNIEQALAPELIVEVDRLEVNEGDGVPPGNPLLVTVRRTGSLAGPAQGQLSITDINGLLDNTELDPFSNPIQFLMFPGQATATFSIDVAFNDQQLDGTQSVVLTATGNDLFTGQAFTPVRAVVDVLDNNQPIPPLEHPFPDSNELSILEVFTSAVTESGAGSFGTLVVELDAAKTDPVTIRLISTDTSEITILNPTVTLLPGQTQAVFQYQGVIDGIGDGLKDVELVAVANGFKSARVEVLVVSPGDSLGLTTGMAFVERQGFELSLGGVFPATLRDGMTFTLSDAQRTVTFEFDNNGSVAGGRIALTYGAGDSSVSIAQRLAALINTLNTTGQLNIVALQVPLTTEILLQGAFGFDHGDSPVSSFIFPFGGSELYGVSDRGNFYSIDPSTGSATILMTQSQISAELGFFASFEGLAVGPQNLDLDGDGAGGDLAQTLFAITSNGELVAFDVSGLVAGQGQVRIRNDVFATPGAKFLATGLQAATGLAFSPLDFNLWHPTLSDSSTLGHGVLPAPDRTREDQPDTQLAGGASFYFGLDNISGATQNAISYPQGTENVGVVNEGSQYGILRRRDYLDLVGYSSGLTSLRAAGYGLFPELAASASINDHSFLAPEARLRGSYNLPGGAQGSLETDAFSLDGYSSTDKPTLYFNYYLQTEGANGKTDDSMRDSARVFISDDNGANWYMLATNNSALSTVRSSDAELPSFASASSQVGTLKPNQRVQELFDASERQLEYTWRQARIDLGDFAGKKNLRLRFDFSTAGDISDPSNPRTPSPLPGDQFGDYSLNTRGTNNNHRGFYIDDIIVGFAEHGEMITMVPSEISGIPPITAYAPVPIDPDTRAPSQNLVGAFQLEIRRGAEYATVPSVALLPDVLIYRQFDTNDRLDQSFNIVAPAGNQIQDGHSFTVSDGVNTVIFEFDNNGSVSQTTTRRRVQFSTAETSAQIAQRIVAAINGTAINLLKVRAGANSSRVELHGAVGLNTTNAPGLLKVKFDEIGDGNQVVDQGQLILHSNEISNSLNYGILIDTDERDSNGSHQGAPRVSRELNMLRWVPGVVVMNNLLHGNQVGGILFSGDANSVPDPANPTGPPLPLPLAAVPFGRIYNNTIYGIGVREDGTGSIGINVTENASPTLLNNIVANNLVGVFVDPTSSTTVLGGMLYQLNATNVVGSTLGSFAITLLPTDPLFVNAAAKNFTPAPNSKAIDSSIDSLQDRPEVLAIGGPLGIGPSPIVTPVTDQTGKSRKDDTSVLAPPGLGQDIYKDRGALDRSDFDGPTSVLLTPADNDPGHVDINNALNKVTIRGGALDRFEVQLNDGSGSGIDDTTATSANFVVKRNGVVLVDGVDYTFNYDAVNNIARFVHVSGLWAQGNSYSITLNNTATGGIKDMGGNPLLPNELSGITEYVIQLEALDFGDAPDPSYPTLISSNGAGHLIKPNFFLGAGVTSDGDGQPGGAAGLDLDDGVTFDTPVSPGMTAQITVTASAAGKLDAWIDFNGDGDWNDPGEKIFNNRSLTAGANTLTFAVPATTAANTFARFRFSSTGGLSPTGIADDGEVEDYLVTIPPSVAYTIVVTNSAGQELGKDEQGRYLILPGMSQVRVEVYVDDLRSMGNAGGVFSAFADLQYSPDLLDLLQSSLAVGDLFKVARTGTVNEGLQLLDEAGGTSDSVNPVGADPRQLLFRIVADLNLGALPGSVINLALNAAEELAHGTLVYGLDAPVGATYQSVQLVFPQNPWHNSEDRYDVNGDSRLTLADAVAVINQLNATKPNYAFPAPPTFAPPFLDVNGDNELTPLDALLVINELERRRQGITSFSSESASGGSQTSGGESTERSFYVTPSNSNPGGGSSSTLSMMSLGGQESSSPSGNSGQASYFANYVPESSSTTTVTDETWDDLLPWVAEGWNSLDEDEESETSSLAAGL